MTHELKAVIEAGDAPGLRQLLKESPALARALIAFGPENKHTVPPLHYVCDVTFRKLVTQEQALAMGNALIDTGIDINEAYARSGDTFLIAAASLGVEVLGVRLVELGADVQTKGLFRATALHWAAMMGLPDLARALIEAGADTTSPDTTHKATPLEWAQHAWKEGTNGNREGIPAVAALLGGTVE